MKLDFSIGRLMNAMKADHERIPEAVLASPLAGITTDSRRAGPGEVFFAIRGERYDGAEFVGAVLEKGAVCAVVNEDARVPDADRSAVATVPDTVKALGDAAGDYRSVFDGPVVAVTGSSGKTTAKEMTAAVLSTRFGVHKTLGNYNNFIGTPLSVFGLERTHTCAVFELGMSAPGEIARLAEIVDPHIGVVLNAGPAHMEFFDSVESVADAKMELLEALDADGTAVVNADEPLLAGAGDKTSAQVVRFGLAENADIRGRNVSVDERGRVSFTVEGTELHLRLPGVHNVSNALAAFAVGKILGVEAGKAAKALESFDAPGSRLQVMESRGFILINDSYNANPLSMKTSAAVLESMTPGPEGRRMAVVGDMLELGAISRQAHRDVVTMFCGMEVDCLCLVGPLMKAAGIEALGDRASEKRIVMFDDAADASAFVRDYLRDGDVALIKGSRCMRMERIVEAVTGQ